MVYIKDIISDSKYSIKNNFLSTKKIEYIPSNQCITKFHQRNNLERNLSLLGLPLAIHLNNFSSTLNNENEKCKKKERDLVGGREKEWYEPFQDQFLTYTASSPITAIHVTAGATLHLLKSFGIANYEYLLYQPGKILIPNFQIHRTVTGNFIFGKSLYEVVHRAYNFITYGGKLEKYLNGRGDIIRDKKVYTEGVQKKKQDGTRKSTKEWLLTDNKYLKLNLKVISSVMLVDWLLSGCGLFSRKSKPYSVLPSLEVAILFVWCMVEEETSSQVMGMFTLPPFIMPIVIGFTSGSNLSSILKGLFAGAYVANEMDIQRSDGEKALQYLNRTSKDFWEMRHIFLTTLKKIPILNGIVNEIEKSFTRFANYYQEISKMIKEDPTNIQKIGENIKKHMMEEQENIKKTINETKENIKAYQQQQQKSTTSENTPSSNSSNENININININTNNANSDTLTNENNTRNTADNVVITEIKASDENEKKN